MTLTQALKNAHKTVGVLYPMGRGQSAYNTWSERHNAWWQGQPQSTARARESRCRALVAATLAELGWGATEAEWAAQDDRLTGDYRSRVRQILKRDDA